MPKNFQLIDAIRDSDSTMLLIGEEGEEKEVIASAIHYNSPRKDGPFVAVNCSVIPKNLIEAKLFGHIKGAQQGKKGYFEEANGGTIFLDEIGKLDKDLQVKLLWLLKRKEIIREGDSVPIKVDVRLIAASNKDLYIEFINDNFIPDLYYRLSTFPIHIPPLKEKSALKTKHMVRNTST